MLTRCKADTCKIMNYVRLLVKPEKTISKHTILSKYFEKYVILKVDYTEHSLLAMEG